MKRKTIAIFRIAAVIVSLLIASCGSSGGGGGSLPLKKTLSVNLAKTGQIVSYDTGTIDDGGLQRGADWPIPRFTVGTGAEVDCVTDNLTGLMWVKAPDSMMRTWQQAVDDSSALTLCDHTDWRLPNRKELRSLVDYSKSYPALQTGHPFININTYYWSSTTYAGNTTNAWMQSIDDGYVTSVDKSSGTGSYMWPVRTSLSSHTVKLPRTGQVTSYGTGTLDDGGLKKGIAWPSPRFAVASSGTGTLVTDKLTGLMWAGDAGTPAFESLCTGGTKTWQAALDYIACLNTNNYLSYSDWRLPNINEIESLIHAEYTKETTCGGACASNAAWLKSQGFSHVITDRYWTSTTYPNITANAYDISMVTGDLTSLPKATVFYLYVWPVRGGQ